MIDAAIRALTRGVRRVLGPVARAVGGRVDAAVQRWVRRTSQRRRTVYLVVFLAVWLGGGGWLMTQWLGPGPAESDGETAAVTSQGLSGPDLDRGPAEGPAADGGLRPGAETDAGPAVSQGGPEGRLARWAAGHRDGWETVSVQRVEDADGRWMILGRTGDSPRNRVATLIVEVAPDGTIRLVEERLP